jgi:predicted Zn-dependent peptidase
LEDFNTDKIIRKNICNGVNLTVIHDEKFKQNQLAVSFLMPLRRETAAVNALLPLVLRHGCRELPDMTALNKRLKGLYGARIDGGVGKRGEVQIVTVYCENLGDSYTLGNEKILSQCAGLLSSVIFDPALEDGCFISRDVEIEKRNLTDQIDALLNEKRQYATMRLKEEMCSGEAYGICELGSRGDVAAITPKTLYGAWQSMIKTARAEIFLIGPDGSQPVEKLFSDAFSGVDRTTLTEVFTKVINDAGEVKTVVERLPVMQAKLVMGLRAGAASPDNTDAVQLACAILGGTPHSKLFANVREKMSLCYYCLSYFERQKGIVFIDSGIEEQNYEKARGEILRQLDELKDGNFTDDDMRFAKLSLQNSYTQVADSIDSLSVYYLGQSLSGTIRTPEQAAAGIMGAAREDVVKAARGIKLDTVYLLAGSKEGGSANE